MWLLWVLIIPKLMILWQVNYENIAILYYNSKADKADMINHCIYHT